MRLGFGEARGEVLMILDADLTVPPEDLPKFFNAIASGQGEFINGSRLVYPMEDDAMRFLNLVANKVFSLLFTWLLNQRFTDTLCGTKVLRKSDYELISQNRSYFGAFGIRSLLEYTIFVDPTTTREIPAATDPKSISTCKGFSPRGETMESDK